MTNRLKFLGMAVCASALLAACGSVDRLASIGAVPQQSEIESPTLKPGYKPVAMPMPTPKSEEKLANSLWSGGSRKTFFEDQRADDVGDILTVTINIQDEANLKNETSRDRESGEDTSNPLALGFEKYLSKALPEPVATNTKLLDIESTSTHKGTGEIKREEDVKLKVAAIVSQILPNGNLVIQGRQEVRVNYENRVLELTGIIRPEDIAIDNTISYEKVAEARVSYGGKGQITDVQQPRYGQQVMDVLSPF